MAVVMMEMRVGADSPALPDAQQLLSQVGFGTSGMAENKKKVVDIQILPTIENMYLYFCNGHKVIVVLLIKDL